MAKTPQETITELRALVIAYTKQETVEPLAQIGRYVGFGLAGAILLGFGYVMLAMGLLRVLQGWGPPSAQHFTGNWSWVPYAIVVAVSAGLAAISWRFATKRRNKKKEAVA